MATLTKVNPEKSSEARAKGKGPFKTVAEASLAKNADLLVLLKRFEDQIQYSNKD